MIRLGQLLELRRAFTLLTGVCMLVAIAFPVWRIVLRAPQYPGRDLPVTMYAYPRLGGEYEEVARLNYYIGFHYPDPVFVDPNYEVADAAMAAPDWIAFPVLLVALAAIATFVAFSSESRIERRLKYFFTGTVAVFVAALAWAQFRLYQAGHSLDPDAPMAGVDGFTPPILGTYEVANISGFSWFDVGGYVIVTGVVFLGVAYLARNSSVTFLDLPRVTESRIEHVRDRFVEGTR